MKYYVLLIALWLTACGTTQSTNKLAAARLNTQLGLAYLQQNKLVLAQEKLQLALQQDDHYSEAYLALAYLFQKTARVSQAEQYYQQALRLAPNDSNVLNNYGAFLCSQGYYQQGMAHLKHVAQNNYYLYPAKVLENLAICAQLQNDKSLAKYYFIKALTINPQEGLARQMLDELDSTH